MGDIVKTWKWKKSEKRNVLFDSESLYYIIQECIKDVFLYPDFETMTEYNGFLTEV